MIQNMPLALAVISFTVVISIFAVGLIRKYLQEQFLDIPNERSSHTQPTPRGGGLGFIIAFAIALLLTLVITPSLTTSIPLLLWLTLVPLVLIGIVDDWRGLPSSVRYLVQLVVAMLVVYVCGDFPIPGLSQLGIPGSWLAVGLTVVSFTALINFYNFMDGLDGLVAGVSIIQIGFLAVWCNQPILWLWVAALIGFLYWNWSPAKIFMGDAGSTTLGAVIGISLLSQPQPTPLSAWTTLAILLPLVGDAVYTLCRRLLRKENIFKAHRSHLYQRLNQAGWPHAQVAGLYIICTIVLAFGIFEFATTTVLVSLVATICLIFVAEVYLSRSGKRVVEKQGLN